MTPADLYARRLAARALSHVLDSYELGSVAVKMNPDEPTDTMPGAEPGEVCFGDFRGRWSPFAHVYLDGSRARVIIEKLGYLIRSSHHRDFDPAALGICPAPGEPDIDVEIDLTEIIQADGEWMRTAPQRRTHPASQPRRSIRVIRSFNGGR